MRGHAGHRWSKHLPSPVGLTECAPKFAAELEQLVVRAEPSLAMQVRSLLIFGFCSCRQSSCQSFYTQPAPNGAFPSPHRNVVLEPRKGMVILDVVGSSIAQVEVLDRGDLRAVLRDAFGD